MKILYSVYDPSGNITALVIGDSYTREERKRINDAIMKKEGKVEQVGFLSKTEARLTMAGDEFCGNAIRCAAFYYLNKCKCSEKQLDIKINQQKLKVGINENQKVWCKMPIKHYEFLKLEENIYQITLDGITILQITNEILSEEKDLKERAKKIIRQYKIDDVAVGVIFVLEEEEARKIFPVVWVKETDTFFLENACGSGTIGVSMIKSILEKTSGYYSFKQPSGDMLETEIVIKDGRVSEAILKGTIQSNYQIETIEI